MVSLAQPVAFAAKRNGVRSKSNLETTVGVPSNCPELTAFGMKYSAAKPTAANVPTPSPYLSHLKPLEAGLFAGAKWWL